MANTLALVSSQNKKMCAWHNVQGCFEDQTKWHTWEKVENNITCNAKNYMPRRKTPGGGGGLTPVVGISTVKIQFLLAYLWLSWRLYNMIYWFSLTVGMTITTLQKLSYRSVENQSQCPLLCSFTDCPLLLRHAQQSYSTFYSGRPKSQKIKEV